MQVHEYAKFFPLMEGEEFDALVRDIKVHGLLEPIILYHDQILDGRNRYRACQKAGVSPRFEKYSGNGVLDYVVSKNVTRRHLSKDQLGIIALDMLPAYEREASERQKADARLGTKRAGRASTAMPKSREQVGKALGISEGVVQRVKRVAKEAPELIDEIRAGRVTAYQADQEVRMRIAKDATRRIVDAKEAKKRQENPREVKEYLEAVRVFSSALKTAKRVAEWGKFSPEAARFVKEKHKAVRELLKEVEAALG